jgi:hypothetical protein
VLIITKPKIIIKLQEIIRTENASLWSYLHFCIYASFTP